MEKTIENKFNNVFVEMGFEKSLMFFFEVFNKVSEIPHEPAKYSKSYFANYYGVDLTTFNKWVQLLCLKIWKDNYKSKRIFSKEEAETLFSSLGEIKMNGLPPIYHYQLMELLFKGRDWKKSHCYEKLSIMYRINNSNKELKLNKLPPKLILEVLKEFENSDEISDENSNSKRVSRGRWHPLNSLLSKYERLTDHELEVKRRYFRRYFSKYFVDDFDQ